MEHTGKSWFDKWHKVLLLMPIVLMLASLAYIGMFYSKNGDFMYKDTTLSGGTTITLAGDNVPENFESLIKQKLPNINLRKLTDISTGKQIAVVVESMKQPQEFQSVVEEVLGYNLTEDNSSVEFTGPALSQSFYNELMKTVFVSFILMAIVIFIIFGESKLIKIVTLVLSLIAVKLTFQNQVFLSALIILFSVAALIYVYSKSQKSKNDIVYIGIAVGALIITTLFTNYVLIFPIAAILFAMYLINSVPSIAVIFAAFADIIITLAVIDIMEVRLSAAGIAAFITLIGFSVDTDILLTTRAMKKGEGSLNQRIYKSFKTGMLMTFTSLGALLPAFFIVSGLPESFRQIFLILAIGLSADILTTWLTNTGIIKIYCDKKGIK